MPTTPSPATALTVSNSFGICPLKTLTHHSLSQTMSRREIISAFNLHGSPEEEGEEDEDVVELVRPPSRQDLLFSQTGLRGPAMTFQLHVTDSNPYGIRSMVYGGPLLRCASRRACPSCQKAPCASDETQCKACLNGDDLYCLHRTACRNWNPSQLSMFINRQNSYLPDDIQDTRSSNYIPLGSTGQRGAAGAEPESVQPGDGKEVAGTMPRPHPPPHHHMVSPLNHQTSTPD